MMEKKNVLLKLLFVIIVLFSCFLLSCDFEIIPTPEKDEPEIISGDSDKTNNEKDKAAKIEKEKAKMEELFYSIFSGYDINNINENLELKTKIDDYLVTYKSKDPNIISDSGVINQGATDQKTTIDVTITNTELNISLTKTFVVVVSEVSPIGIKDYHSASGIYRIKVIVSAVNHNSIYIEDDTGKTKIILSRDYISTVKSGDELLITFDDSQEEKIIGFEVLSSGNQISKSVELLDLIDASKNYYRRINVNELEIIDIVFDQLNSESDFIITLSDGTDEKVLSIYNKYILADEEMASLIKDLEIGDVLSLNNIICDDNLFFVEGSSIVRTKKIEINYSKIDSIFKEGTYFIKGRVSYILSDSFIISDNTGNKIIQNPEEKIVEVGKDYSIRVEAVFDGHLSLVLQKIKLIDQETLVTVDPIYINGYLINSILSSPVENNLYVEMIGEIVNEDSNIYLLPYGTDEVKVSFNKDISSDFINNNVRIVGYINSVEGKTINLLLDKINLASEVRITPLNVEIELSKKEYNLFDLIDIKANVYPDYANYANSITWEFDNNDVCKLDSNGNIRAVGFGKVKITAKTGNNLIDQVTIEVKNLDSDYLTYLLFGENSTHVVLYDEVEFKPLIDKFDYTYSYDHEMIEIKDGKISGKKVGETDILITVNNVTKIKYRVKIDNITISGYDISPSVIYKEIIPVKSKKEFNDVLIDGYLNRYNKINIRFDYFVESNNPIDLIDPGFYEIARVQFNTYYIEKDRIIQATYVSLDGARGTLDTIDPTPVDDSILYINELLDLYAQYTKRRSNSFNDFKLYSNSNGKANIRTCQELYLMLERGYEPNFVINNSTAELLFERAKDILRNIITDDMSDYLKVKAIYDYIVLNVDLDKKASLSTEDNLKSNDLEGAFDGLASEEGLAKMFVLFCRIEGINASLVKGENRYYFKYWNIVNIDDVDYLVSLGDGIELSRNKRAVTELFPVGFSFINYSYFLKKSTMFRETYPQIVKGRDTNDALNYNIFKDEKIYDSSIDFQINSQDELNYLFNLITSFDFDRDYYVYISSSNFMIAKERVQKALDFAKTTDRFVILDFTTDTNNKQYGIFVKVGNND